MKKTYILLVLILLLAVVLRAENLFIKDHGTDEKRSIEIINNMKDANSIKEIKDGIIEKEINPPLYFLIVGKFLKIKDSVKTMKIVTLIIGLLSIFSFYLLSRSLFNEKISILATLLYTINPLHVAFSQHIRAYIFIFLIFNLSMYFNLRYLRKNDNKSLIFLTITNILAMYVHYFAILFIMGQGITTFILYLKNKRIKIRDYIIAKTVLAASIIPSLLLLKQQMASTGLSTEPSTNSIGVMLYPIYKFINFIDISTTIEFFPYLFIPTAIILLIFAWGIFKIIKKKDSIFILGNFIAPYIILIIIGLFHSIYSFRYLTFLLTPFILVLTLGIFNLNNKTLRVGATLITIGAWLVFLSYYYSILPIYHWNILIAI